MRDGDDFSVLCKGLSLSLGLVVIVAMRRYAEEGPSAVDGIQRSSRG